MVEPTELTEERALELAWQAVEIAGGTRAIYRNPKYAYSLQQTSDLEIDGVKIELRHGEISSPAIVTVGKGWVFEIHDEDIELLIRPRPKRAD
ncbi:MAG TPA: protein-L-isoaspartate o-methyltransferase 1 [Thermomicrobiales bacterium]|nr:protein-L-isoaspartate o-methyltransferase 1 [Thermomicrobiales bacterium]